jgi:hypothetical protein
MGLISQPSTGGAERASEMDSAVFLSPPVGIPAVTGRFCVDAGRPFPHDAAYEGQWCEQCVSKQPRDSESETSPFDYL